MGVNEGRPATAAAGSARAPGSDEEGGIGKVEIVEILVADAWLPLVAVVEEAGVLGRRQRRRAGLAVQLLGLAQLVEPHLALLGFRRVERKGRRRRAQFVEVDEAQGGGVAGQLHGH